jgi:hypothetical protein
MRNLQKLKRHAGFIKVLRGMRNRSVLRTIRALEAQIQEHEEKLRRNPASRDASHWQGELKTFREQLELAKQEATRRKLHIP